MKRSLTDNQIQRRGFLASVGVSGAAIFGGIATAAPAFPEPVRGSDRPVAAVIGLGSRGRGMAEWQMPPFADVVAICDVDLRKTVSVAKLLHQKTDRKVEIYQDYRRILDRKDVDVIGNATCEHWHTKINVEACRAGKDLYAEKPLGLTIDEGKILSRVVAETGRVVQVGTQQRSGPQFQIACSLVRNGRIGKLKQVAVIIPAGGIAHAGPAAEEPIPKELNWDMWSGQAPLHLFSSARLIYRHWSEYGGGLVTDWGAHHMDIAHWGMGGKEVGPLSIEARGYCPNFGKPGYPDHFCPFVARLEYPGNVEMWFFSAAAKARNTEDALPAETSERLHGWIPESVRNYPAPDPDGGVLFVGSTGSIFVGRQAAIGEGIGELEKIPLADTHQVRWRACLYQHTRNLVDCVRTRQQPTSCVADMHRSLIPCHLTNIALRLGRKLNWDAKHEAFVGDDEANGRLRRPQRKPYQIEG
jgi:predicted dehydrogenase